MEKLCKNENITVMCYKFFSKQFKQQIKISNNKITFCISLIDRNLIIFNTDSTKIGFNSA